MFRFNYYAVAVACSCLLARSFYESPDALIYIRFANVAVVLTALNLLFNARFIYAFYTSPLIDIPLVKVNLH